jgi:hypothetical protein
LKTCSWQPKVSREMKSSFKFGGEGGGGNFSNFALINLKL